MHVDTGISPRARRHAVALSLALVTLLAFATVAPAGPAPAPGSGKLPKDIREVTTKHYVIHTNIAAELADDLARRMDAMHEEYSRRMKDFAPPKDAPKLPAYLFAKHAEYREFTGTTHTGGVFVGFGEKSFLAAHLEILGRDELRRTLQHEGFHQFAYAAIGEKLPLWMNEGIAELFNDAIWNGRTFLVGQVWPRRLRRLQHDIEKRQLIPFKDFTTVTSEQWHATVKDNPEKATTYYNQAWAMVYFLGESGRAHYRKRLIDFLKKIDTGGDPAAEWKKAFPNMDNLQNEFARWATTLRPSTGAIMLERQETLATMLILSESQRFTSMSQFRNYVLTRRMRVQTVNGQMRWTSSDRPAEYFESPGGDLYDSSTQLFFEPAAGRPLPDIVCRAAGDAHFRTRFYRDEGGKLQHEVLVHAPGAGAR
jgi:hypothetical protein